MYERIMILVGPDPTTCAAVAEGVALAKVHAAQLLFFSVLPAYTMPLAEAAAIAIPSPEEFAREASANAQRLLDQAATIAGGAGVQSATAIGSGPDEVDCVLDAAKSKGCGLIVVASRGRNAVVRIIGGSVIPGLITRSTIPVLIVRQQDAAR